MSDYMTDEEGPVPPELKITTELFFICMASCWFFIAFGSALVYRYNMRNEAIDAEIEVQTATVVVN